MNDKCGACQHTMMQHAKLVHGKAAATFTVALENCGYCECRQYAFYPSAWAVVTVPSRLV